VPDVPLPPKIVDLTELLQRMLALQGADERTASLIERLVRAAFEAGRAHGAAEVKAVVDERLV
jgi:hypothetical protein